MCGLEANDYTISSLVFLSLRFSICTSDISRALEPLKRQVFVAQNLPNDILECLGAVIDHRPPCACPRPVNSALREPIRSTYSSLQTKISFMMRSTDASGRTYRGLIVLEPRTQSDPDLSAPYALLQVVGGTALRSHSIRMVIDPPRLWHQILYSTFPFDNSSVVTLQQRHDMRPISFVDGRQAVG